LHFTLKQSDKGHLTKFLKEIKYAGIAKDYFTTSGHWVCKVSINSKKIYNDLIKYGITERKSLTVKPYKFDNIKLERAYWRGIVDGDGWITKEKPIGYIHTFLYCVGLCGNNYIVNGFKKFIENNGIEFKNKIITRCSISYIKTRKIKTVAPILTILYKNATIYLDRKYQLYLEAINELSKKI